MIQLVWYFGILLIDYNGIEEQLMLTNSKHNENSCAVEDILQKYAGVLTQNYEKQERQLLDNLYQQVKVLKQELIVFKREVSSENIEKLINERRRQKEKERQILENRWRQCNQSFKALQEQQKKLINQQKQYAIDATNLQKKIEQSRKQIDLAKQKSNELSAQKDAKFMTETKENYNTPKKIINNSKNKLRGLQCQKPQKLLASTSNMFGSKNSLIKFQPLKFGGQNKTTLPTHTESNRFQNSFLASKGKVKKVTQQQATDRYSILQQFLNDPQIRLKLFKIIKKQL